jgi:hypothetical protein
MHTLTPAMVHQSALHSVGNGSYLRALLLRVSPMRPGEVERTQEDGEVAIGIAEAVLRPLAACTRLLHQRSARHCREVGL